MPKVRDHIRFILNVDELVLRDVAPEETLLDFLRLRRALTGSKEGCAEGDCGACTVLVGRLKGGRLVYETVTACIRFVASLDRCHVVTIEHLRGTDGGLHPVQQAMVDLHGSQCGFCTPGFVMSLYALWMRDPRPSDRAIEKALQGNLCRCTGYESIMRAARAIADYAEAAADPLAAEREAVARRLAEMDDGARVEIGRDGRRAVIPADADDLAAVLQEAPGTIVAGSTDVGLWVTKHFRDISPAIFIGGMADLQRVSEADSVLSFGAGVTYTEAFAVLGARVPALGRLLDRIGGEQVRNMGTLGGNVANGSPIGDTPPPLIALGTTVTLRRRGERRVVPLEDFFIAYGRQDRRPDEFVESMSVPLPGPDALFEVYKVTKRRDEDITAVLGAFHIALAPDGTVGAARIAYGGMAGTPKRAGAVEAALVGQPWTEAAVQAAMPAYERDFTPLTDMRASAEYRMLVAKNLLMRFFLETSGGKTPVQVTRAA